MLRYSEWDAVPIWVPGFFGIYSGMLYWAGFRILQYLQWNVILSWFPNSSIFTVERYTNLVSKLFNIYNESLFQSFFWSLRYLRWDATPIQLPFHNPRTGRPASASVPCPGFIFFSCRLEASARGRWHRAGLLRRRGDYYLGCGRRRYCGRACCLSRRRVLALPQCF